jgi:hypothetical protein
MRRPSAEHLSRRGDFQPGRAIELADGQEWTFPSPDGGSRIAFDCADEEYHGLIRAVAEAENHHERLLAELALAIFLLRLNYDLGSEDLEFLLTFPPDSAQLRNSQQQFRALAADHFEHVIGAASPSSSNEAPADRRRPTLIPVLPRLRALWRLRRWPLASRRGEVLS